MIAANGENVKKQKTKLAYYSRAVAVIFVSHRQRKRLNAVRYCLYHFAVQGNECVTPFQTT